MLDIKLIRENPAMVKKAIADKNEKGNVDKILEYDEKRREVIYEVENLKRERNDNSALVGQYKKEKKDTSELIEKTKSIGIRIKELDQQLQEIEDSIYQEQIRIPNIPHPAACCCRSRGRAPRPPPTPRR